MAARLAPHDIRRMHQSLHHLVADAPWKDQLMLAQVRLQHVLRRVRLQERVRGLRERQEPAPVDLRERVQARAPVCVQLV